MLLDLMSPYNQIPVNVKAINIFGLACATYWATLADIFPRVISKKYDSLISSGGYFTVDREYVQNRTSLTLEYQYACDLTLERVGVLAVNPDNSDSISISMDRMFEILAESDAKVLDKVRKQAKVKKTDEAEAKRIGMINTLAAYSATLAHTPAVQEAYKLWITAMVESKKAKISKPVIDLFHQEMCSFTQDSETQIKILHEATASGYTNASWVINSMQRSKPTPATRIAQPQKAFTGIDTSEVF